MCFVIKNPLKSKSFITIRIELLSLNLSENVGTRKGCEANAAVKIAQSFLQSVSDLFHFIILSLPV